MLIFCILIQMEGIRILFGLGQYMQRNCEREDNPYGRSAHENLHKNTM